MIFSCVVDIIFASIFFTFGYFKEAIYEHIKVDSIFIIILSIFILLSACLKICCYEIQTIVSFFSFIIFHSAFTIRILALESHSVLLQFIRISQLILLLILLLISIKLIYNICISLNESNI